MEGQRSAARSGQTETNANCNTRSQMVSRPFSMRHTQDTARRLRDSRHAGLCGVAMAFEHVMILQLV
jgi:hypothetical protein